MGQYWMFTFVAIFICSFGYSQKTHYIKTDNDDQVLYIDNVIWDGDAFHTVDSDKSIIEVVVKELGYMTNLDVLQETTNHTYQSGQYLNLDTNMISIIKPIELEFVESKFDFKVYELDYSTYLKDIIYNEELDEYTRMENEGDILNSVQISNQYLIDELNEYHNNTIGRYEFYTIGKINSLYLFFVKINESDQFVHAIVKTDWSITARNTENLPTFLHRGESGKIILPNSALGDNSEAISLAVNDAVMSSLFYFLEEQQDKIASSR